MEKLIIPIFAVFGFLGSLFVDGGAGSGAMKPFDPVEKGDTPKLINAARPACSWTATPTDVTKPVARRSKATELVACRRPR